MQACLDGLAEGAIEVTLKSLSLSPNDVQVLKQALVLHGKQIQIVSLLFCEIDPGAFHLLCEGLASCPGLQKLDLFNTLLPDALVEDLLSLGLHRKDKLVELNLHSNSMTDRTAVGILCRQLSAWPVIAKVNLSNNELTQQSAQPLLEAVIRCPTLVEVGVNSNSFSDQAKIQLREACYANALKVLANQTETLLRLRLRSQELERKCNVLTLANIELEHKPNAVSAPRQQPQPPPLPQQQQGREEEEEVWPELEDMRDAEFSSFIKNREVEIAQAQQRSRSQQQHVFSPKPLVVDTGRYNGMGLPRQSPPQQQPLQEERSRPTTKSPSSSSSTPRRDATPTRMPLLSPGQWQCIDCQYNNAETRQACLSCQRPRSVQQQVLPPSRLHHPKARPGWTCSSCTFTNLKLAYICEMCNAQRRQ